MPEADSMQKRFEIDFEPIGRRIDVDSGANLLDAAREAGIDLASLCGGSGLCDSCRIQIMTGEVSPATAGEIAALGERAIRKGERLACQTIPLSDLKVHIPPESLTSPQRLQVEGMELDVPLNPAVVSLDVDLDPPSLMDVRSDLSRLQAALVQAGVPSPIFSLPFLQSFCSMLRELNWSVRLAMRGEEVIAVLPRDAQLLGVAIDIGTTKVAAYLVDLLDGTTVAKKGAMNPQVAFGEDVVSRIAFANKSVENRVELQSVLIEAINTLILSLCEETDVDQGGIVDAVVVGNTAMHHAFLKLPLKQLGESPYVPAVSDSLVVPALDIGLEIASGAKVYLPANIAGYVGADHIAVLVSLGIEHVDKPALVVDIGTNTEISLAIGDRLLSCSCASGPAFEGAHIHDGMRAAPGAIERVRMIEGELHVLTIGDVPPVGICGSGVLDSIAQMRRLDFLDRSGRFKEVEGGEGGLFSEDGFVLVPAEETGHGHDLVISRGDVNEIQLAKAAIRAGIEILLDEVGVDSEDLRTVIVAGAFGTYLDIASAIEIGLFPEIPLERFRQVGNAAGEGARQLLLSNKHRGRAEQIADRVEYIELTVHDRFTEEYLQRMFL